MEVNRKGKDHSFINGTKETLQNSHLPSENSTDFGGNRKHQYGPVLQMMTTFNCKYCYVCIILICCNINY